MSYNLCHRSDHSVNFINSKMYTMIIVSLFFSLYQHDNEWLFMYDDICICMMIWYNCINMIMNKTWYYIKVLSIDKKWFWAKSWKQCQPKEELVLCHICPELKPFVKLYILFTIPNSICLPWSYSENIILGEFSFIMLRDFHTSFMYRLEFILPQIDYWNTALKC